MPASCMRRSPVRNVLLKGAVTTKYHRQCPAARRACDYTARRAQAPRLRPACAVGDLGATGSPGISTHTDSEIPTATAATAASAAAADETIDFPRAARSSAYAATPTTSTGHHRQGDRARCHQPGRRPGNPRGHGRPGPRAVGHRGRPLDPRHRYREDHSTGPADDGPRSWPPSATSPSACSA